MPGKIKSLLDELDNMVPERDKHVVVEARADHFINSGIRLLEAIEKNFEPELAEELTKRLFSSLRSKDFSKFQRKIRALREADGESK